MLLLATIPKPVPTEKPKPTPAILTDSMPTKNAIATPVVAAAASNATANAPKAHAAKPQAQTEAQAHAAAHAAVTPAANAGPTHPAKAAKVDLTPDATLKPHAAAEPDAEAHAHATAHAPTYTAHNTTASDHPNPAHEDAPPDKPHDANPSLIDSIIQSILEQSKREPQKAGSRQQAFERRQYHAARIQATHALKGAIASLAEAPTEALRTAAKSQITRYWKIIGRHWWTSSHTFMKTQAARAKASLSEWEKGAEDRRHRTMAAEIRLTAPAPLQRHSAPQPNVAAHPKAKANKPPVSDALAGHNAQAPTPPAAEQRLTEKNTPAACNPHSQVEQCAFGEDWGTREAAIALHLAQRLIDKGTTSETARHLLWAAVQAAPVTRQWETTALTVPTLRRGSKRRQYSSDGNPLAWNTHKSEPRLTPRPTQMTVQAMAMARLGLHQIHEDRALAEKCISRAAPYLPEMAHLIATTLRARKDDEGADGYLWLAVISKRCPSATFELAASLQKDPRTHNLALDLLQYAAEQGHKAAEEARTKLRATIRLNLWAEKPPPVTRAQAFRKAQTRAARRTRPVARAGRR